MQGRFFRSAPFAPSALKFGILAGALAIKGFGDAYQPKFCARRARIGLRLVAISAFIWVHPW